MMIAHSLYYRRGPAYEEQQEMFKDGRGFNVRNGYSDIIIQETQKTEPHNISEFH